MLALAACTHKVQVEAPKDPIVINLNVKIEQEVRVKVEKDVDDLLAENPDLFSVRSAPMTGSCASARSWCWGRPRDHPGAGGSPRGRQGGGAVGERVDGYLGVVGSSAPADVAQLVEQINAERRAKYADIAGKQGAPG